MKIKEPVILIISAALLSFSFAGAAQNLSDLPIDESSGVIYDNDDTRDVYTDEYLLALSHLEDIDLKGIITTYAANDDEYRLFVKQREEIVEKARRSGLTNLPKVFPGTNKRLKKPASNTIEDTKPLDIPGSRFIVEQAKKATPVHPLVIVSGGQLTAVANAWLLDPSIGDRVIVAGVFGVRQMDYNAGLDGWAWKIVLSGFRVLGVPFGTPGDRGEVYMKPPVVPKIRIKSELPQSLPLFEWMFKKHHPSNPAPDGHDYDGQPAIPLVRPDYITKVKRWRVKGIDSNGELILREDPQGPIFEALQAKQKVATEEFWRAMKAAARSVK